ncbi:hypothetical protein VSX61_21280 [Brenneria populi subsp. brevivirga]|uniref:hypothetical protein n=1 Tax=Brenneria populi TaxID=1505588 RepID=UPI002E178BFB|nr:hypothetical protein [Brenneria populi subsp. brevivirga]
MLNVIKAVLPFFTLKIDMFMNILAILRPIKPQKTIFQAIKRNGALQGPALCL